MRYFVTGASGWIGSAVTRELLAAGHEVEGLARSDASAATIIGLGADVRRGELSELHILQDAAAASDGVIHLGYSHDFTAMAEAAELDRQVIDAFGAALEGTGKPLLIASGTLGLRQDGRPGTEQDRPDPAVHPRVANATAALALADKGVRSIVVRFAPTVHGTGDHGFVAYLVQLAREKGVAGYVDDGANRWPAVHRDDAARLVHLAIERVDAAAPGTVLHAVDEDGVPIREIAGAIGRGLDVPAVSVPAADAVDHFAWMGGFIGADAPASSAVTRELLDWSPTGPRLIDDLDAGHYFDHR